MHLFNDDAEGEFSIPLVLFLALRTLLILSLGECLTHYFGFPLSLSPFIFFSCLILWNLLVLVCSGVFILVI